LKFFRLHFLEDEKPSTPVKLPKARACTVKRIGVCTISCIFKLYTIEIARRRAQDFFSKTLLPLVVSFFFFRPSTDLVRAKIFLLFFAKPPAPAGPFCCWILYNSEVVPGNAFLVLAPDPLWCEAELSVRPIRSLISRLRNDRDRGMCGLGEGRNPIGVCARFCRREVRSWHPDLQGFYRECISYEVITTLYRRIVLSGSTIALCLCS